MVVNRQNLWGCEFYAWGRTYYRVQGFLTQQAVEEYVSLFCRDKVGTRTITRGARI